MIDTNKLSALLSQYQTLCHYCDTLFHEFQQVYQSEIRCAAGCAACCSLETVVPLEAFLLARFLEQQRRENALCSETPQEHRCPFLLHGPQTCSIYPVRPLICRTHGLPIRYPDRPGVDMCPLNFTGHPDGIPVEDRYILDAGVITTNLIKLNLAFCLLHGRQDMADTRVALSSVWHGEYQQL